VQNLEFSLSLDHHALHLTIFHIPWNHITCRCVSWTCTEKVTCLSATYRLRTHWRDAFSMFTNRATSMRSEKKWMNSTSKLYFIEYSHNFFFLIISQIRFYWIISLIQKKLRLPLSWRGKNKKVQITKQMKIIVTYFRTGFSYFAETWNIDMN